MNDYQKILEQGRIELSEVIKELRLEQKISQTELYQGLCSKKAYERMELGEGVADELLVELLFSRLHAQYRLLDIMLDDEDFWKKESRAEIDRLIQQKKWKTAGEKLLEYEERAVGKSKLQKQYVVSKKAQLLYLKGEEQDAGELFLSALQMTMEPEELERRLGKSGVVSVEEVWMYSMYRKCCMPFGLEGLGELLGHLEEMFLKNQIYEECLFEIGYWYCCELLKEKKYELCSEICQKMLGYLKTGVRKYRLAEFYCLDAVCGINRDEAGEKSSVWYQQFKMAYYTSLAVFDEQTAGKIAAYAKEEYGWHITD